MSDSSPPDWVHTAVVLIRPASAADQNETEAAIATILASPEFEDVSVHPFDGSTHTPSSLMANALREILVATDATSISIALRDQRVENDDLLQGLERLGAVPLGSLSVTAIADGDSAQALAASLRATIVEALAVADATAVPRKRIESAVSDSPERLDPESVSGPSDAERARAQTRETERRLPQSLHNAVGSVSSQFQDFRARRARVRRAEEVIGVAALEQLHSLDGTSNDLLYLATTASPEWSRQAIRTRDAALTLITHALDERWIAVAVNVGESVTRVAGPASPAMVVRNWRRIDRSNDFDLGPAASAITAELNQETASLQRRAHNVNRAHVVLFATEPPYIDSAGDSAYSDLLGTARSVTWFLIGDSDWMEIPTALRTRPSSVVYAEKDGVHVLLNEILDPSDR